MATNTKNTPKLKLAKGRPIAKSWYKLSFSEEKVIVSVTEEVVIVIIVGVVVTGDNDVISDFSHNSPIGSL